MSYSYSGRGPSKAAPSTICQKCLQKGHYSYECKSAVQERPYASRPSRSQQLLNPPLRAQLTNIAPDEPVQSKGIADKILKDKADERRRKRSLDRMDEVASPKKRARSMSYSSTDSVSTISTNRSASRSRSHSPTRGNGRRVVDREARGSSGTKRRRSISSQSDSEDAGDDAGASRRADRNTRHRRRSTSPDQRGRRKDRSLSYEQAIFSQSPSKSRGHTELPSGGRDYYRGHESGGGNGRHSPPRQRERSLSPYSKRVALTRDKGR